MIDNYFIKIKMEIERYNEQTIFHNVEHLNFFNEKYKIEEKWLKN